MNILNIKSKFCILIIGSLFFIFSCRTIKPIRTLKEVESAYRRRINFEEIERLKEATMVIDRDVAGLSVYYLGLYLEDINTTAIKKMKRKLPKNLRSNAKEEINNRINSEE